MEFCRSECGKYKIECMTAATVAGGLKVIKDAFCQDEAVCIGCEIDKNPQAAEELLELCADVALDNASMVAVEIDTGNVVAVAFNKIQVATPNPKGRPFYEIFAEQRCTQESSKSLIHFMADADGRCNLFYKYGVDCALEIMFLATLREHRGHNLGTLLCKASIDLARKMIDGPISVIKPEDLGPKYSNVLKISMLKPSMGNTYPKLCQAFWTAGASQKIGEKLNFEVALRIPFSEYRHDGKTYSERLGNKSAYFELTVIQLYP